jgi:hypothetical protein
MADRRNTGLIHKFNVTRTDGQSEPGQKHDGCDYFVLDLTHDKFALNALIAYADVCRHDYPVLSMDLDEKIAKMKALQGTFFSGHRGAR